MLLLFFRRTANEKNSALIFMVNDTLYEVYSNVQFPNSVGFPVQNPGSEQLKKYCFAKTIFFESPVKTLRECDRCVPSNNPRNP